MKMKNKFLGKVFCLFACFLCLVLAFSHVFPASADGEEKVLLALGDSISAGYGLEDLKTQCFVNNVLSTEHTVINKAVSGNTAKDIIDQLQNKENENFVSASDIKKADYITITIGGNDLMAVLYEKTVEVWNAANPDSPFKPEDVTEQMAGMHFGLLATVMNLLNPDGEIFIMNDPAFEAALKVYVDRLSEITSYINGINPNVAIIVATQYNPYVEFKDSIYSLIYHGIEAGVLKLNYEITSNAKKFGYVVADVKTAFDSYTGEGDLYNASQKPMNVDFHPSADGHKLLAETFGKTIADLETASYYVCHYYEKTDGTFEEVKQTFTAPKGKKITVLSENKVGFSLSKNADEVKTAEVSEGFAFKLFYTRNTYKIGFHTYDEIIFQSYKYGEKITPPEVTRRGYKFKDWDKSIPKTMPATDLTIVARWEKKSKLPLILAVVGVVIVAGVVVYFINRSEKPKKPKKQKTKEETQTETESNSKSEKTSLSQKKYKIGRVKKTGINKKNKKNKKILKLNRKK